MTSYATVSRGTPLARAADMVALKLLTVVYRRVLLLARPCTDAPPIPAPPGVSIGVVRPDEIDACLRLRPDLAPDEVRRRLERGDECWAARAGDRIVHAAWVARGIGPAPYLEGDLVLGDDDLFSYDSFTAPAWRGRGLAAARHAALLAAAHAERRRRVACIAAVENRSGRRALAKAGYAPVALYGLLRLGPVRLRRQRTLAAEPAPALRPAARADGRAR